MLVKVRVGFLAVAVDKSADKGVFVGRVIQVFDKERIDREQRRLVTVYEDDEKPDSFKLSEFGMKVPAKPNRPASSVPLWNSRIFPKME